MDSGVNQVPLVNPSDKKTQTSTRKDELGIWLKEKLVPHFHKTIEGLTEPVEKYEGEWVVTHIEEMLESDTNSSEIFWTVYDLVVESSKAEKPLKLLIPSLWPSLPCQAMVEMLHFSCPYISSATGMMPLAPPVRTSAIEEAEKREEIGWRACMSAMSMPPPPPKLKRQSGTEVPRVRFADEEVQEEDDYSICKKLLSNWPEARFFSDVDDDSIREEPLSSEKEDTGDDGSIREEPLSSEKEDTGDDDSIREEPLSTDKEDTRVDVFTSRGKLVDLMQEAQEDDTRFAIKSTLGTLDGWLVEKHLLTKKEDKRWYTIREKSISTEKEGSRDDDSIFQDFYVLTVKHREGDIDDYTVRGKLIELMQEAREMDTLLDIKSTLGNLDGHLVEKHLLTKKEDIRDDDSEREDFLLPFKTGKSYSDEDLNGVKDDYTRAMMESANALWGNSDAS